MYNYTGGCPDGFREILNVCYIIPGNFTLSWNIANQLCQETYPTRQGSLAYSHIKTAAFRDYAIERLQTYGTSIPNMWVGVQRNPWVWITG